MSGEQAPSTRPAATAATSGGAQSSNKENKGMKRKAGPPFYGVLGLLFLGFFAMGLLSQIGTTQAALLGGGTVDFFKPNWEILLQPLHIVGLLPPLSGKEGATVVISWFISLAYVGCVVGNEIFDDVKNGKGPIFTNLFRVGIFAMVSFNFWTDLQYGTLIYGMGGSAFLFAIVVAFIVAFAGVIGTDFIEKAYKLM
jgi:hypothetical protein